jgi:serine/threonine protein kinase
MTDPMTPGDFEELDRLFHQAVDLPAGERTAFVSAVAVRSPALGRRLEALLVQDGAGTVGPDVAEVVRAITAEADPLVGERFGAYRIERVIGRGGMGAVYLGRRADDAFEHDVAIKTILAGLESPAVLERFRREREILARLDHPGVARLLDGGTGPRGVPYVVMEYVDGVPITRHVTGANVSLRQRLELFLELCDAVQFVHRNLIVHRDIKPGNVLVTADRRVKLLDFGIARLTDEFEAGGSRTATGDRVLTPEYASPEQVLGQPVTTATDVYALGVLLYELLTGVRPLQFSSTSPYDIAREIVDRTPLPPSQTIRQGDAPVPPALLRLARQLEGDLDRIVLMAMRKEPERRYPSVAAFADDVRAWLDDRPVTAHADTWRYRVRKFVRRHPAATGAAAIFAVIVIGFTIVTVQQSHAIRIERDNAVSAESRATATADFLTSLFETADPRGAGDRNMAAFELLQAGVDRLEADDTLDPEIRADLYMTLGLSLSNLEEFDAGIPSLRSSLALSEQAYGRESLQTAERMHRLGDVLRRVNAFDEALALLTEALEIRREFARGDTYQIADSYNNIAILAIAMGEYVEADRLQTASVDMHTRLTGPESIEVATPLNNLALLWRRQGRYQESLELANRAVAIRRGDPNRHSMQAARLSVAQCLKALGRGEEAIPVFRAVADEARGEFGPGHSRVLTTESSIAQTLHDLGRHDEAERIYEDLDRRTRAALGEDSVLVAVLLRHRGRLDRDRGRLTLAARRLREALDRHLRATGSRHFRVPSFRRSLAEVLIDTGQLAEAEAQLLEAIALLPSPTVLPHIERGLSQLVLSRALRLAGRLDEARRALDEAETIAGATTGPDSDEMAAIRAESELLAAAGPA